ncbi:enhanced serine sensitivity protein SseB C-terminal domain-containing protein [Paenibacillus sp. FJAT-26967]|uniref:enhanced serine sensitivity protein SseB C-terminal domain-containing protein n=1 Tax=Paenibacillus sp. FJAT-26967 TaxID=1729690 RepID=UPI000A9ADCF2|nr:enhanced serine sensitivity protein SseB C-terminal domain-containing protein [Paenibacillus sp. FJAT-26967]
MNQARAEELVDTFLRNDHLDGDAYSGVEIQEVIFLIHHAKSLAASQPVRSEWLNTRIQELNDRIKEKIKEAEALYIAFDKQTNYPYVDAEGRVWVFSKEQYTAEVKDYFLQQFILLEMKEISGKEIMETIGLLHIMGLPTLLIDNGQYYIEVKRDELMPPMNWSGTPEIQVPVTNPGLQQAMILFFQTMNVRLHTADNQQRLQRLEARMLDEIIGARYLLPIQLVEQDSSSTDNQGSKILRQGDRILTAVLEDDNDSKWLPAFTDWYEFEKAYDKELWSSNVATYEDLAAISSGMTGIVINSQGLGLRLDSRNRAKIEEYRRERSEASSNTVTEAAVPEEPAVLLVDPKEYPMQMIESLKAYMKTQKGIQKAYLRQKIRGNEQSYLLIVDATGGKEQIYNGIAAAAAHLNGIALEIVGMDDWIEDGKDIEPFYKRKRFGLF